MNIKVFYAHEMADPLPVCRCAAYSVTAQIAFRGDLLILTEVHSPRCRRGRSLLPTQPKVTDLVHDCGTKHRRHSALAACEWRNVWRGIHGTGHLALLWCGDGGAEGVDLFDDDTEAADAVHAANVYGCGGRDCPFTGHELVRLVLS